MLSIIGPKIVFVIDKNTKQISSAQNLDIFSKNNLN